MGSDFSTTLYNVLRRIYDSNKTPEHCRRLYSGCSNDATQKKKINQIESPAFAFILSRATNLNQFHATRHFHTESEPRIVRKTMYGARVTRM